MAVPTVTTQACTNVLSTSATLNGNITNTGGVNPTLRGFCYMVGTSGDPTTSNSLIYTTGSFGTGAFSENLTGLSANTSYRVRAAAQNSSGIAYGTTVQLTTAPTTTTTTTTTTVQVSPTVALNTPSDTASITDATPTFNFTGTDTNGDTLEYQIQIDTVNTFNSIGSGDGIIDSYSESNRDDFLGLESTGFTGAAQSFTGAGSVLDLVKFFVLRSGSPTGNAVAKIYTHSGTFGIDSIATGTALATSDNLDVSTISNSAYELKSLTFSGANRITLQSSTKYVVALEYAGGDASNVVLCGIDVSSSTHGGNLSYAIGGGYNAYAADVIFYVYTVAAGPLLNKVSSTDTGFTAGHPFASGAAKEYTVQSDLSSDTYYWRVRAIDPSGLNIWGSWSSIRSFTLTTTGWTTKSLKVYIGGSWVTKPLKAYVGGSWVTKNLKIYQ